MTQNVMSKEDKIIKMSDCLLTFTYLEELITMRNNQYFVCTLLQKMENKKLGRRSIHFERTFVKIR